MEVERARDRVACAGADFAADMDRWRACQLADLRQCFLDWANANIRFWNDVHISLIIIIFFSHRIFT